jgi:hypothetical protein
VEIVGTLLSQFLAAQTVKPPSTTIPLWHAERPFLGHNYFFSESARCLPEDFKLFSCNSGTEYTPGTGSATS